MNNPTVELSPRRIAREAGIWYALLAVLSVLGIMYADARFYVAGDAAATAGKILADEWLFRLGLASNFAGQVCFLFAGLAFYKLFESVDKRLARTLLALVVASIPIAFINILNKSAPLILLGNSVFAKSFAPAQLQALALLFLELEKQGMLVIGIFWGLWLLPLGLLVYKSDYFPKVLGVLLMVNCAAYLVDSGLAVLAPGVRVLVSPVTGVLLAIGEIPFLLWLLIRGAR